MSRRLMIGGAAGTVITALCCFTPILAVLLPAVGLGAWLSGADYVLFPLLAVSLGLLAFGLYRRRAGATGCCEPEEAALGKSGIHER
jgi:mercuric ion transport protein